MPVLARLLSSETAVATAQGHIALLSSMDAGDRLRGARALKNAVIGSKTQKALYLHLDALAPLSGLLETEDSAAVLLQAVHAVASLASGTPAQLQAVLSAGDGRLCARLVQLLRNGDAEVVEATGRALRVLFQTAGTPRHLLFDGEEPAVQFVLRMLGSGERGLQETAAGIIARCCLFKTEKLMVATPSTLELLMGMLSTPHMRSQEAALDALSTLLDGSEISLAPSLFLPHTRSKRARIRLLACKCITNLSPSAVSPAVLPTIIKLFSEADPAIREEAPLVLGRLISGDPAMQKSACEVDAIERLAEFLRDPHASHVLLANTLEALAAVAGRLEECRQQVVAADVVPLVVEALDNENERVRASACVCARSMSRSVKTLRTALNEAGIGEPLFRLLYDGNVEVQTAACAALCNMVLNFSPMKRTILECGGVARLVELTQAAEHQLRLNAVWALKNMVYFSDSALKQKVLKELPYTAILDLVSGAPYDVQEQALGLLRNLPCGSADDVDEMMDACGPRLLSTVQDKLASGRPELVHHALYVVCNMAAGSRAVKDALMAPPILEQVKDALCSPSSQIKVAAIWCVINFVWAGDDDDDIDDDDVRQKVEAAGIVERLVALQDDPVRDVRERAASALKQLGGESGGK